MSLFQDAGQNRRFGILAVRRQQRPQQGLVLIPLQCEVALLRQRPEQHFTNGPAQDGARAIRVVPGKWPDKAAPVAVIDGTTGGTAI